MVAAELEGCALVDLDGDGVLDVRVTVRAAKARVPPRPDCVMGSVGSGDPPKVPRLPRQIVEFLARAASSHPPPRAPASSPRSPRWIADRNKQSFSCQCTVYLMGGEARRTMEAPAPSRGMGARAPRPRRLPRGRRARNPD